MDIREIHQGFTVNKSINGQIMSIEAFAPNIEETIQSIIDYLKSISCESLAYTKVCGVWIKISQESNVRSLVKEVIHELDKGINLF